MIKKKLKLKWKIILTVILIITFLFLTMRFIGTKGIIIREYKVTSKIPKSLYGIKIVHFTDLHYGMGVDDNKLKKLVNLINETKPDIVFFTGDLLDNKTKLTEDIEKILVNNLSKIKSTYGNYYDPYYKIGNTDFYISGGIGNSKVNLRLFNQPSFNLYRLVDK